jgi:hypothetical protein
MLFLVNSEQMPALDTALKDKAVFDQAALGPRVRSDANIVPFPSWLPRIVHQI